MQVAFGHFWIQAPRTQRFSAQIKSVSWDERNKVTEGFAENVLVRIVEALRDSTSPVQDLRRVGPADLREMPVYIEFLNRVGGELIPSLNNDEQLIRFAHFVRDREGDHLKQFFAYVPAQVLKAAFDDISTLLSEHYEKNYTATDSDLSLRKDWILQGQRSFRDASIGK